MPATAEGVKRLCSLWQNHWTWGIGRDPVQLAGMIEDCEIAPTDEWLLDAYQAFRESIGDQQPAPTYQAFFWFMHRRLQNERRTVANADRDYVPADPAKIETMFKRIRRMFRREPDVPKTSPIVPNTSPDDDVPLEDVPF